MRTGDRWRAASALSIAMIAWAPAAQSQSPEGLPQDLPAETHDPRSRWIPSIGLGVGLNWQQASADLRANPAPGVSFSPFSNSEGTSIFKAAISPDLMLETPVIANLPGKPRLFIQLGAVVPLGQETSANDNVGDAGGVAEDPQLFLTIEWDSIWYAGLGVSIELPIGDSLVFIKPSVNYIGQSVEWVATMEQQIDTALGSPLVPFSANEAQIHQGIAGKLQLETNLSAIGPVTPTVFIAGQAGAWLWGDRSGTILVDTFVSDGRPSFNTSSEFTLERFHFNVSAGIRLSWTGR